MSIVIYNPLPPLTEGAFLRAGWTPQVINGVVPDLSGFGKTGTPTTAPCPAFECDPYFGSTLRTYANESGYAFPSTLTTSQTGTWSVWVKRPTLTLSGLGYDVAMEGGNNANDYLGVVSAGSAFAIAGVRIGGVNRQLIDNLSSRIDVWTHILWTWDGANIRLYVDGLLRQTSPVYVGVVDWNIGTGHVGYSAVVPGISQNGNIRAPFILSRCWSDADVAAYYSSARAACWKSDFGVFVDLADQGGVVGAYL